MAALNVYALGGGLGHAMRLLALARVATARGHVVRGWVNASRLPDPAFALPGLSVERIPRDTSRAALRARIDAAPRADLWVVDTFPRGILGELEPSRLGPKRIWIHRDLAPAYAEKPEVLAAARAYDAVLVPGGDERAPLAGEVGALRTAPWLALDRGDLLSRDEARAQLVAGERKLVVVSSAGPEDEAPRWRELAERLTGALPDCAVVLASLDGPRPILPLLKYLAGVDLLVGAGGYHTVNEARATATPLLAFPQPRTYDRQALRLRAHEQVRDFDALVTRARQILASPRLPVPPFESGAHQGLEVIESLLG